MLAVVIEKNPKLMAYYNVKLYLAQKKKKRPKQLFLMAGRRDFAPFSLVRLSLAFSHALHLAILKRLFHLQCVTTRVWGL